MAKFRHTIKTLEDRLQKRDLGHITVLVFDGSIDRKGVFSCKVCGTKWEAIVNNIISKRPGKRCPKCIKPNIVRKSQYSDEERAARKKYYGSYKYKVLRGHTLKRRHKERSRYKKDITFRLTKCMRTQVSRLLKGHKSKEGRLLKRLPYNIEDLKTHLEKMFDKKMTWENYGKYWEIDHIIPVCWYMQNGIRDAQIVNSLDNLRPLTILENRLKKGNYSNP